VSEQLPSSGGRRGLVSVVIPTFNMARFLPAAVSSVLRQTYPDLEVHVIDDGSSDDPRGALGSLLGDPRVRFQSTPQGGQARAKNRGIQAAAGSLIAFLDADDLWVPDKLERQVPLFDRPEIGVVYTDYQNVDPQGQPLPTIATSPKTGRVTNELFVENFVTGMTAIVRRECFDRVGMFDESIPMGIDYDLWLRISVAYEFAYLDYRTYLYRTWEGQMSRRFSTRLACAIAIMERFLERHPGVVPPKVQREAWAHTFTYGGEAFARRGQPLEAVRWLLRAIRHYPDYWPAWYQLAALPVRPLRRTVQRVGGQP
jgi:glycosyltransferase involved in cell wall biosynthesis